MSCRSILRKYVPCLDVVGEGIINIFVLFLTIITMCGLEKLGLVDQNWLERICPICC